MVIEWALMHREELRANWERAREQVPLHALNPWTDRETMKMKLGPRIGVRAVEPLQGFRMLVTFDNNVQREVDFERYLQGPVFQPMRADPMAFCSVTIVKGVITWPNGADIDPDVLYYGLAPACLEQEIART